MNEDNGNIAAKLVSKVLKNELSHIANTASCSFVYQPKEPKGIEKFKKRETK